MDYGRDEPLTLYKVLQATLLLWYASRVLDHNKLGILVVLHLNCFVHDNFAPQYHAPFHTRYLGHKELPHKHHIFGLSDEVV